MCCDGPTVHFFRWVTRTTISVPWGSAIVEFVGLPSVEDTYYSYFWTQFFELLWFPSIVFQVKRTLTVVTSDNSQQCFMYARHWRRCRCFSINGWYSFHLGYLRRLPFTGVRFQISVDYGRLRWVCGEPSWSSITDKLHIESFLILMPTPPPFLTRIVVTYRSRSRFSKLTHISDQRLK